MSGHQDVEAAGDKDKPPKSHETPPAFKVQVTYNGVTKDFEVRLKEVTVRLLEQAKEKFGPIQNAHLLGLFNADGVELQDNATFEQAGVKPGDLLLMRPSQVRGG